MENQLLELKNIKIRLSTKFVTTAVVLLSLVLGSLTGFLLAGRQPAPIPKGGSVPPAVLNSTKNVIVGSSDTKTFKDCAKGEIAVNDGKITNEGSHKLLREGGESQTVYLTSSVVDLNQFTGKKLEVCGETFKAQKAGWLMDVGRVKLL